MIDFLTELYATTQDWYERNSWFIFPAYFLLIIAGWGFSFLTPVIPIIIGLWICSCVLRRGLNPAIIAFLTALGIMSGIKNEPETIGEEAKRMNLEYAKTLTRTISVIALLPFTLIALLSAFDLKFNLLINCIPAVLMIAAYYWHTDGKYVKAISMTVSFGIIIWVFGYTILTSDIAKSFGVNIAFAQNALTNKAAIDLENSQNRQKDFYRSDFINDMNKQLTAQNAAMVNKKPIPRISPAKVEIYNNIMKEIGSRKQLVLEPKNKVYVLTETPSAVAMLVQKGRNFF